MIERYLFCPAISNKLSLTFFLLTSICFIAKSTPTVTEQFFSRWRMEQMRVVLPIGQRFRSENCKGLRRELRVLPELESPQREILSCILQRGKKEKKTMEGASAKE